MRRLRFTIFESKRASVCGRYTSTTCRHAQKPSTASLVLLPYPGRVARGSPPCAEVFLGIYDNDPVAFTPGVAVSGSAPCSMVRVCAWARVFVFSISHILPRCVTRRRFIRHVSQPSQREHHSREHVDYITWDTPVSKCMYAISHI